MEVSIDYLTDLLYGTLWRIKKDRLAMTFGDGQFGFFNMLFNEKAVRDVGDMIKDYVTLKDTGNGKHISQWEDDSHNVINTNAESTVNWTHYTSNVDYNAIDMAINEPNEVRIYRMIQSQLDNMFREMARDLQRAAILSPTGSTDKKQPHGLSSWLSLGTDDSVGGWTGYSGRYNDGSGTTYNVGGIASSSSSNARWASYYADHKGQLGDYLIDLLFRATTELNFVVPMIPKKGAIGEPSTLDNFQFLTGIAVMQAIEHLLRKSDDSIGMDLGKYNHTLVYKGIPFVYSKDLNTARTSLYGTDPIFGINFNHFKVTILRNRDFLVGKPYQRDDNHNVLTVPVDLSYAISCDNREQGGFLISQQ